MVNKVNRKAQNEVLSKTNIPTTICDSDTSDSESDESKVSSSENSMNEDEIFVKPNCGVNNNLPLVNNLEEMESPLDFSTIDIMATFNRIKVFNGSAYKPRGGSLYSNTDTESEEEDAKKQSEKKQPAKKQPTKKASEKKPEVDAAKESETDSETDSEVYSDTEDEEGAKTKKKLDTAKKPEVDAESEFEVEFEVDSGTESKVDSEKDPEADVDTESEEDSEEDTDVDTGKRPESEAKKDSKADTGKKPGVDAETESDEYSEMEFEVEKVNPRQETKSIALSVITSETEQESDIEPELPPKSKSVSKPEKENEYLIVSEDDTEEEESEALSQEKIEDEMLKKALKGKTESDYENSIDLDKCIFEHSLKTNKVIGVVKHDLELYGTLTLTLLCGRMIINGYKVPPFKSLNIYSPKGFNWVHIAPQVNKKAPKNKANWQKLSESFTLVQLQRIMANYRPTQDAIVLLQRNSNAKSLVETFAQHMAENVFPVQSASNRPYYASEQALNCLIQRSDKSQTVQVPPAWHKLAQLVSSTSRIMVTGGKGVGKSTLIRYLVNHKLENFTDLLLIDLDIGQPEIFVPQTVSCSVLSSPLLGPGLFLNQQPVRAYVVGHVNVVMCAEQYMRAVRQLLSFCSTNPHFERMPWFINTMGYNKGFGLELISMLANYVHPTDVVQIDSFKTINNFDKLLHAKNLAQVVPIIYTAEEFKPRTDFPEYILHRLNSALPETRGILGRTWQMSAKDVRYANLLARLSATLRVNCQHLTDCAPLWVHLDALQVVHLTSDEYSREELIAGMEANVVYLCKRAVDKQPVECLGIGVVRAIDHRAKKLYLLPAMPLDRMDNVNCLVLGGDLSLPQGYIKQQGSGVATKVPFVFIVDDSKSSKSVQQIYHRSPQFLGSPISKKLRLESKNNQNC